MGIVHPCCFPCFRIDQCAEERRSITSMPSFDLSDALELLPPDVFLKRNDPIKPSILLSDEQFQSLQKHLPMRFQGYRWRLLFGEEYHGFSRTTLAHKTAEELEESRGRERPAILLIAAGSKGEFIIGAYLSCIPPVASRRYTGNEETFVFCLSRPTLPSEVEKEKEKEEEEKATAAEEKEKVEEKETKKRTTPMESLRVFRVPADAPNRYFVLCQSGAIAVGGGGKGPAILLHNDLSKVSCSSSCPTFGLERSLLMSAIGDNAEEMAPDGINFEAGETLANVKSIQLWRIGDECFFS